MKRFILFALSLSAFPSSLAMAQGTADLFEVENYKWLDHNRRIEYPADLDGDGKMELVGWWSYWSTGSSVQVFFWDHDAATGTWSELEETFGSGNASYTWESSTAIGDFDGDGKDEMAVLNHWGIEVFEPNLNGKPKRIVDQDYNPNISALDRDSAVCDFDGDGRDDIVLVAGAKVYLYKSVLNGFSLVDTYQTEGGHLSVTCADAEGDQDYEVVVLQERVTPRVQVFQLQNMTLRTPHIYTLEPGVGGQASDDINLSKGDIDGDGDTDLVLFGMGASYQVLRRGPVDYSVEPSRPGGPATDLVDINGDGNLDGICCGGGGGGGNFEYNEAASIFELCLGDGTGNFDTSVLFDGLGAEHVAGAMDFDGDGDLDIVAGRVVLLNRSEVGGTFCDGAINSTGSAGVLHASGRHSKQAGGPELSASGLPASTVTILLGANLAGPNSATNQIFWDGNLCLKPFLARLRIAATDASGNVSFGGMSNWNSAPYGIGRAANSVHGYQVWYRDNAAGQSGANISGAIHVLLSQ